MVHLDRVRRQSKSQHQMMETLVKLMEDVRTRELESFCLKWFFLSFFLFLFFKDVETARVELEKAEAGLAKAERDFQALGSNKSHYQDELTLVHEQNKENVDLQRSVKAKVR
jgi:hypothetical protein